MKKEIADLWVAELRSGKRKQAFEQLRDDDHFCCLGVLCDISGQLKWEGSAYGDQLCQLPFAVQEWAGLNSKLGAFRDGFSRGTLSNLNDVGMSFDEIADVIEQRWQVL